MRAPCLLCLFTLAAACAPPRTKGAPNPAHGDRARGGKGDAIGDFEQPEALIDGASRLLSDNLVASDVGQTFGTDDAHVPYPDTYWPFTSDGIDQRWSGGQSPLEKLVGLTAPGSLADAKAWEHKNHGSGVPGVADWFGHCPGWTGAAMDNTPILHAVNVKGDGQGGLAACADGDAGCVAFQIGDLNALMAEVYVDGASAFIGARCDTKPSDVKRDANGRITQEGCDGVNAGSLLIVASTLMKQRQQPFAIDAQDSSNTAEIWNQPAYRYTVNRFEPLATAEAANLVAHGQRAGDQTSYPWNTAAQGFALVDLTLSWVTELGPNSSVVSGARSTATTRMVAVIELSAPTTDPSATILGGEFLDDPSVGASRLTVAPFVWVTQGPGPDGLPTSVNGDSHNPYVSTSVVRQLIALGQQ
jgi:hypothetical protein